MKINSPDAKHLLKLNKLVRRLSSSVSGHKRLVFWGLMLLVLSFIFWAYIKSVFVIVVLGIISVFSTYYKRFMRVPPAVELVTFSTVMVGLAYGPVAGAVFGAIVTLIAEIANTGVDAFIVGYVPARATIGFVSYFFPHTNIVVLGTAMSLLYNVISQPLYAFQGDVELRMKLFAFIAINLPFNFLAFSLLGNLVKGIIM